MSAYGHEFPFREMRAGDTLVAAEFVYVALATSGTHTGRRHFAVWCLRCGKLVTPCTTGPRTMSETHLGCCPALSFEVHGAPMRGRCACGEDLDQFAAQGLLGHVCFGRR